MTRERRRMHGGGRRLLAGVLAVCLIGFAVSGIMAFRDIHGLGAPNKDYVIEIPEGTGTAGVANILRNRGIIRIPAVFKLYIRFSKTPVYQMGRHTLNPSMSYHEILSKLQSAPDADGNSAKRVTVPEGYELRQIVDLLVEKGLGDRGTFMNEIEKGSFDFDFVKQISRRENRLEGYLYPDTYLFSAEETEHQIINRMLETFQERVVPVYTSSGTSYSLDQIVILASMIEREAASDEERPLVSSVFYNRIDRGMKLESCATVQYILKERKKVLSNSDIAIDSKYNTYMYQGLPEGPIASPGLHSVEAALQPAKTDYLYFVAEADGSRNLFSETFDAHNQKIQETQGN